MDLRLGEWIVRPQRRVIERGDESVHVKPKSMSVFECLAGANGAPVSRNELFDQVWPGGEVSDDTLTKCIVELRKAFHDSPRESRVIETIPKLGFRLLLPAEPLKEEPLEEEPPAPDQPATNNQKPRQGKWRNARLPLLLLVAAVLVLGTALFLGDFNLWSTDVGDSPLQQTVATAPHEDDLKPGIAVLPFVNMSSDTENEYFSDGISEEILNALANTNRLPVIARTSSFQFKGDNRDVRKLGRLLDVTHVLEGSVRKEEDSIRVTAQLIDAATGAHVWSQVYQRELSGIFKLQHEIATHIVDQVSTKLGDKIAGLPHTKPAAEFMATHRTANLEAYDLYLKGVQMLTSTRPAQVEQAVDYFDRAIALDQDYADAWAAKGWALQALGRPGHGHSTIPASVYPQAIAAFRRALEIEPQHALAMGRLGWALILNDYQWAEGMELMKQSLARNPHDAMLLALYAYYLGLMDIKGGRELMERVYRLDPLGMLPINARSVGLMRDIRLMDTATLIQTSWIENREGYPHNYYTARYNLNQGQLDAAEEHVRKARLEANPVDLSLDTLGWGIDLLRGEAPIHLAGIQERIQTERLTDLVNIWAFGDWADAQSIVEVFDLAIEQRHFEVHGTLFSPKPPLMPEADWVRIKEITGVTQFQENELPRLRAEAVGL